MGTGCMGKLKSISSKVLISYLFVVVFTFAVTALAFFPMLVGVLERRAEIGLEKQAWGIAHIVERRQAGLLPPQERNLPLTILLLGRSIESDFIMVDTNDTITFSSSPDLFPAGKELYDLPTTLREDIEVDEEKAAIYRTENYLAVEVPVGITSKINGNVLTFVSIKKLQAMYRETLYQIFSSLLIALSGALLIAYFLIRHIVRPLKTLESYAEAVGNRQFDIRLEVKSDDEISQLATAFNQMADRLKGYDASMRYFFQNASHEMKTPLMSINGYAEGIRDGVFTGAMLENAVDVIHKESLRLKNIVDNMIDITILDQPHNTYFLPNDLRYIVENVVESVGGYAVERKVELWTNIEAGIWVIGDWEQLHSLFTNLLSNGIRHARTQVTVQASPSEDRKEVWITIQDDGKGFSEADIQHAFDYFYTRAKEGSGLGLTIARKIVQEHFGRIKLGNAPEGGARVEVFLPVLEAAPA